MKVIGLVGGMSWESTTTYYQLINREVARRLGGLHSARILLHSVDFFEIEKLQAEGRWDEAGQLLATAARSVERGGADVLILCTNTMHKVTRAMTAAIKIPFLHIVDPTGAEIQKRRFTRVGLLATRFTMEMDYYKDRLTSRFGVDVLVPERESREKIHHIIYEELCLGVIRDESKEIFKRAVTELSSAGAEAVILGCTEIDLLLHERDVTLPLIDTTQLHAIAAVDFALS